MLKEFALDPELLGNWQDFRFFTSQFGASQGRLISRFPAQWTEHVKNVAKKSARDIEYLKIVEALARFDSLMLIREYDYEKGHQWLRNAVDENAKRPFQAIVTTKNHNNAHNLVIGNDIDPTKPPPLWVVPTSAQINRTPEEMAACVKDLLSQCKEVLFVDPYFAPNEAKYTEPLRKFLKAIGSRGTRCMPNRVEYHLGNQDRNLATFKQKLNEKVGPHLPQGLTLTFVRWKKSELHNRYVLTDRGGVMFGHGLDRADGSDAVNHDTVSLLDDETCNSLLQDYSPSSKKLTWLGDDEVFTVG